MTQHLRMAADDSKTCCTVETPSRLMLFYPADSTPASLTAFLPHQPIQKPVGEPVTLGRSSSADIRLNDDRMSRQYAALWHDGKDPFVFRIKNLSDRKMLLVNGNMLRYGEEAEVRDQCSLTLDFLQLKAKVCAGDLVAFSYKVTLVKDVVLTPPVSAPRGRCIRPSRLDSIPAWDFPPCLPFQLDSLTRRMSLEEETSRKLRADSVFRTRSVDSGCGPSKMDDFGLEYELAEYTGTSFSHLVKGQCSLDLNIPPSTIPHHCGPGGAQVSANTRVPECWFSLDSEKPEKSVEELPEIAQRMQDILTMQSKNKEICTACPNVCGDSITRLASLKTFVKPAIEDMDQCQLRRCRSPTEHSEEWDTDDPNINCYMK